MDLQQLFVNVIVVWRTTVLCESFQRPVILVEELDRGPPTPTVKSVRSTILEYYTHAGEIEQPQKCECEHLKQQR